MEENSGTSKTSGLLARIQALQSQEAQKTEAALNAVPEETISPATESIDIDENYINPFEAETFDFIDTNISEDDFTLGDYTLNQQDNNSIPEEDVFSFEDNIDISEPVSGDTSDDFDFDSTEPVPLDTSDDFNFDSTEPVPLDTSDDFDFDSTEPVPLDTSDDFDFDSTEPVPLDTSDDFDFDSTEPDFSDPEVSQGLSFTGLYDRETIMGESSDQTEEIRKKTKVPVIICIICALICLIATTLILFVIPSKYNLIKKTVKLDDNTVIIESTHTVDKTNINDEDYKKLAEQANVPPAKENTIVVIEKAEDVIPLPPVQNKKNMKDEVYKIKWGDTLWDIANTFYRSPWKYKKIASYNKISNPDYIITGTVITIPAE